MQVHLKKDASEIYSETNIDNLFDDYMELDEAVVPIVQLLIKKGYRVSPYCDSGSFYKSYCEMYAGGLSKPVEECIAGVRKIEPSDKEGYDVRVEYTVSDKYFRIGFDKDTKYVFNITLPEGCEYQENWIEYKYQSEEFFEYLLEKVKISKALYEWAKELPQLN